MKKHRGLFITFEKTAEGLGGTTQALLLHKNLQKLGIQSVLTREPGGTHVGQKLREILLDPKAQLGKATELFILMADRSQHYKEILKPTLKIGGVVISDRYFDSTLAYQGAAGGWKTAFLMRLHQATTGLLMPDLTFVLHGIPYRELNSNDSIESRGTAYHAMVKAKMLSLASESSRYILVDANQPLEALSQQILNTVKERYPNYFSKSE